MIFEEQANEALEGMNRRIRQTQQVVQPQTIELAQEYFGCSVEMLKQQVKEGRNRLEDLPKQVPCGQKGSFRILFQEGTGSGGRLVFGDLRRAATKMEYETSGKKEAEKPDATSAVKHKAKGLSIDTMGIEGTGYGGLITMRDVLQNMAEA